MGRNAGGKPQYASSLEVRRPACPEMRLACAVIVDAFDLARLGVDRPVPSTMRYGGSASAVVEEARAYFASDDRDWPYSFLNLCDALGLDVEAVRARVRAAPPLAAGTPLEGRRSIEGRRD